MTALAEEWDSVLAQWWVLRLLGAVILGAGLGAVGSVLQRYLSNDLADPHLVGISSSSLLGAVLFRLFFPALGWGGLELALGFDPGQFSAVLGAFGFGLLALVFLVLSKGRLFVSPQGLILVGVMVNAFAGALTLLLMTRDNPIYPRVDFGLIVGRVESHALGAVFFQACCVAFGMGCLWRLRNWIAAEPYGLSLRQNTQRRSGRQMLVLLFAVCVIVSTVSAFAGSVGFVGLIVPHLARRLPRWRGRSKSFSAEFVLSSVLGALLLASADVIAQWAVYPSVLPVGVVTALAGSVALAVLLAAKRRQRQGVARV